MKAMGSMTPNEEDFRFVASSLWENLEKCAVYCHDESLKEDLDIAKRKMFILSDDDEDDTETIAFDDSDRDTVILGDMEEFLMSGNLSTPSVVSLGDGDSIYTEGNTVIIENKTLGENVGVPSKREKKRMRKRQEVEGIATEKINESQEHDSGKCRRKKKKNYEKKKQLRKFKKERERIEALAAFEASIVLGSKKLSKEIKLEKLSIIDSVLRSMLPYESTGNITDVD